MNYRSKKFQIGRFIWLAGLGIVFVVGKESVEFIKNVQKIKTYLEEIQHPFVIYMNNKFAQIVNVAPEALDGLMDTFDSLFFPEHGILCAEIDWVTEACLPFE
ncbi:hypothetical protein MHK_006485 [Candidatus Magnetomorum sp. HK-1]|nr:hypothetical protein MHK_006485 [Candidatus Magnetomorum sp. HK-1]